MLAWYLSKIKEHGLIAATLLLCRVVWVRGRTAVANRILPSRVLCPCCGWEGHRFYDYIEAGFIHRNVECPQCNSHSRHRALFLWLEDEYALQSKRGAALIVAPEQAFDAVWKRAQNLRPFKIDLEDTRRVDVLADLQRLPFATNSIALIWCHHVLQCVEDDRAAMRELCRVLHTQTGELVVSVALAHNTSTREYGFANKEVLYFWRMYGDDFLDRLAESGFKVRTIIYEVSPDKSERYGINSQEEFYVCKKASAPNPTIAVTRE